MTGPPINIETRIEKWLEKSHLKCETCPTGSLPYIDELLNNLQDFKLHIINEVEGADKVLKQLSSGTKFATGANWVMKFTNENIPNPSSFESFITDGEKYTVDILADGIYYECKSWSGNLLAKANLTAQLTNYLHNEDITSLDQFGLYFDPAKDRWTPNKIQLNNGLRANSNQFDIDYWEKYRQLFGFTDLQVPLNKIDKLIDFITQNHYNNIINP